MPLFARFLWGLALDSQIDAQNAVADVASRAGLQYAPTVPPIKTLREDYGVEAEDADDGDNSTRARPSAVSAQMASIGSSCSSSGKIFTRAPILATPTPPTPAAHAPGPASAKERRKRTLSTCGDDAPPQDTPRKKRRSDAGPDVTTTSSQGVRQSGRTQSAGASSALKKENKRRKPAKAERKVKSEDGALILVPEGSGAAIASSRDARLGARTRKRTSATNDGPSVPSGTAATASSAGPSMPSTFLQSTNSVVTPTPSVGSRTRPIRAATDHQAIKFHATSEAAYKAELRGGYGGKSIPVPNNSLLPPKPDPQQAASGRGRQRSRVFGSSVKTRNFTPPGQNNDTCPPQATKSTQVTAPATSVASSPPPVPLFPTLNATDTWDSNLRNLQATKPTVDLSRDPPVGQAALEAPSLHAERTGKATGRDGGSKQSRKRITVSEVKVKRPRLDDVVDRAPQMAHRSTAFSPSTAEGSTSQISLDRSEQCPTPRQTPPKEIRGWLETVMITDLIHPKLPDFSTLPEQPMLEGLEMLDEDAQQQLDAHAAQRIRTMVGESLPTPAATPRKSRSRRRLSPQPTRELQRHVPLPERRPLPEDVHPIMWAKVCYAAL